MNTLLIKNAQIVTPNEIIESGSLVSENGKIKDILFQAPLSETAYDDIIDGQNQYLLPGIIDIHTDAIEKEISPRPGANFPIDIAFRELERRMSGCGITTVYHSIYLGYYAAENNDTETRLNLFRNVHRLCKSDTIIDNRIHLRFEITGIEEYMTCLDLIEAGCVQMLSFMDHSPGQGQYGSKKYMKYLKENGHTEEEIEKMLEDSLNQPRLTKEQMQSISYICQQYDIPIASHDDDNAEKVAFMHSLGASICEFPINFKAAQKGIDLDMYTVGGASNVLRGGSLSGNLHVQEAIEAGVVNTLCSDYYPPSILHAIFKLSQDGTLSLPSAVQLGTLGPAKAASIDHQKGSIEIGKEADLILVAHSEETPWVSHTFLKGKPVAQASVGLTY